MKNPSPGLYRGGFGRPGEATCWTEAALTTTMRGTPAVCIAGTTARVPRAGDARLGGGSSAQPRQHRVGPANRGKQRHRVRGREIVHNDAYRQIGEPGRVPDHNRYLMTGGYRLGQEVAANATGRGHNRELDLPPPLSSRSDDSHPRVPACSTALEHH